MSNLTLNIDAEILQRARIRALERGTTVNALVRDYLYEFAGEDRSRHALDEFLALTEDDNASSGPEGRTWTRDDIYDV